MRLLWVILIVTSVFGGIDPQQIASKEGFTAVLFTSSWCSRCNEVVFTWNEVQSEEGNTPFMLELPFDNDNQKLFAAHGITNPPAMMVFMNSTDPVLVKDDYSSADTLRSIIQKCVSVTSQNFDGIDKLDLNTYYLFDNYVVIKTSKEADKLELSKIIQNVWRSTNSFDRYGFIVTTKMADVVGYYPSFEGGDETKAVLFRSYETPFEISKFPFDHHDLLSAPLPPFAVCGENDDKEISDKSLLRTYLSTELPRMWFLSNVRSNEQFPPHPGMEHVPILFISQPFVRNVKRHFKISLLKKGQSLFIYQTGGRTYLSDSMKLDNDRNITEVIEAAMEFEMEVLDGAREQFVMTEELIPFHIDTDYMYHKQVLSDTNIKRMSHLTLSHRLDQSTVDEKILVTLIYTATSPLDRAIYKSFAEVAESIAESTEVKTASLDWERNDVGMVATNVQSYPCIVVFIARGGSFVDGSIEIYIGDYSSVDIVMTISEIAASNGVDLYVDHSVLSVDEPVPSSGQSIAASIHSDLTASHFVRVPFTQKVISISIAGFLLIVMVVVPIMIALMYVAFTYIMTLIVTVRYYILLRFLYWKHDPDRITHIRDLLQQHEGHEKSFYETEVTRLTVKMKMS
eukprot:TRINITY_DN8054_c1_g2_i1.p1 TRINITY_DN8054_c1_g2~~TRINITY_DN8054_c1_g2_i1.p1  ORF type:complete len:626 (+),score=118.62 TRINITY_DN8054_c1_g2_i1:107-1984(+)